MKLLNITLLFASIASSSAQVNRNLAVCEDKRGKFKIPEVEGKNKEKNCQFVRKNDMTLCTKSKKVLNKCPKTCGLCDDLDHAHDHDHDHDHEVLAADTEVEACIDIRGKFFIRQLGDDGAEKNCQFVKKNMNLNLCAKSWKVRNRCPNTCGECASDEEEALVHDHEVPVEDAVCEDKSGKTQLFAGYNVPERNCLYIGKYRSNCVRYWMVRKHCPKTCGTC